MTNKTWMTDQRLHQIDPHKLDFLQKLVFEMQELSDQDKLPFLMALATSTKKHPVNFSKEEIELLISVLKEYSSEEEMQKMNKVLAMFQNFWSLPPVGGAGAGPAMQRGGLFAFMVFVLLECFDDFVPQRSHHAGLGCA